MTRHLELLLLVAGAIAAFAEQQPSITNADLRQASAASGLEPAIRAASSAAGGGPAWIGYAAPAIPGDYNHECCWSDNGRSCGLEGGRVTSNTAAPTTPVRLEGPSHVVVLLRYEMGSPEKLRVFSPDCPLDAGGLPFHWLSNVKPAESIAMLTDFYQKRQETRIRGAGAEAAIHAIALHAGPEAEAALMRFASIPFSEQTRKSALFWLARSRGRVGYGAVAKIATSADEPEKVREHAIFAISQSKQPEAIPALIRIASEDKSPQMRKKAMFWLGQSRDPRALEFLERVLLE